MTIRAARALAVAVVLAASLTACSSGPSDADITACNQLDVALTNLQKGSAPADVFAVVATIGKNTSTPFGDQLTAWAKDSTKRISAGETAQKSSKFGKSVSDTCEADGVLVPDE
jgi:hypothetical protein